MKRKIPQNQILTLRNEAKKYFKQGNKPTIENFLKYLTEKAQNNKKFYKLKFILELCKPLQEEILKTWDRENFLSKFLF